MKPTSSFLASRLLDWFVAREQRRRDLIAVARMDQHLLDDIGMTRHDLRAAIRAEKPLRLKAHAAPSPILGAV